ncbi:MAG TPA: cytochrome C oxidase subunit IV family protein [Vulgatibacter sp.]|nr:cytochrome C oxidase subunit IV family protein [Vulgatibacter sp.]
MSERPVSVWLFPGLGAGLLLLLSLSLALSFVELGRWSTWIHLGIATVQAGAVVWFSMELFQSRFSVRMLAIITPLFVLLLVALTAVDPATRAPEEVLVPGARVAPEPDVHPLPGMAHPASSGAGAAP